MTRSKLRKIRRQQSSAARALLRGVPLAGALLASAGVQAQQAEETPSGGLEEVVVTALKTQQNLQDVPLSIQAIGTERLEELGVKDFADYVKFLPSVSVQSAGPGFGRVFMRGAASGDNGNHSGSQPGVGQYLDEQPITTIQGALDIHMYDIARVESLAGPQGTLYGANSQAGTIRIITNKPDPKGFEAGFGLEGNAVAHGDQGYLAEGFVNVPLGDRAAIRMVGWARHDAGYIDNLPAVRTFPGSGISMPSLAEDNYNDVDTYGARVALKVDLNDNWSITPTIMGQQQKSNGVFAQESGLRELAVEHWHPENSDDRWTQAALTVEGKIANLDMTFASSYLKREVDVNSDYSDYSFFYDTLFDYGHYFTDDDGNLINPSQFIQGKDGYTKWSQELRFTTPLEYPVHAVFGLFAQRQTHDIQQDYRITGLATASSVTGWPEAFWLTKQYRVDRDSAAFGEVTWDATEKLSFTGGVRFFRYENSLEGFFGFGATNPYESSTGEGSCFETAAFEDAPCTNLDKTVKDNDSTYKINATYKVTDDVMFYVTRSEGFRPGGVNRRGTFPPYKPDFLTNYEIGWKTSFNNDRLRFNGAIYHGDWDNFQFSFLGGNGLTNVTNAPGGATLDGIEMDIQAAITDSFSLYGGIAYVKAELADDFCLDATAAPGECDAADFAPEGTRLPITAKLKGSLTGRYEFPIAGLEAHVQGSLQYNGDSRPALLPSEGDLLGDQPSYTIADFAFGVEKEKWELELFVKNAFDERANLYRYTECSTGTCANPDTGIVYSIVNRPRTIGLKFNQKF
ncbi:MAG TPA: TonB-dependent receptor [Steroidobacteraceae bacterium]|nr:TonB-dependent receptor [Steroidobacteraceae bacterium]